MSKENFVENTFISMLYGNIKQTHMYKKQAHTQTMNVAIIYANNCLQSRCIMSTFKNNAAKITHARDLK